jgi:uncharacterized protein (TIGR02594 family)
VKISDIQQRLAALGFRPGTIDGVWGRVTAAALKAFQLREGLDPDGIAGPLTLAALFPGAGVGDRGLDTPTLVWFQEARRLLGTREKPGSGSNDEILEWADDLDIHYPGDDIPWCGLFVGHCIAATLDREPIPADLLRARAWARFGIKCAPMPGAVLVFSRGAPDSGLGHVGFYAGQRTGAYRVLGGNQSDSVSLAWLAEDRLIATRWPTTVPPLALAEVRVAANDRLSWNEA